MSGMKFMKGKTLKSVSRGTWEGRKDERSSLYGGVHRQNKDMVTLHCTDGDYVFVADGDCCSRTFVAYIEGPEHGFIQDVLEPEWGAEYKRMNTDDGYDDVTKFYKTTLVIEGQGHMDIEYRNESNGYYGGNMELVSAPEWPES